MKHKISFRLSTVDDFFWSIQTQELLCPTPKCYLCSKELRKRVSLPKKLRCFQLVFSDIRPEHNHWFELTAVYPHVNFQDDTEGFAALDFDLERQFDELYERGFRYAWIEYYPPVSRT